MKVRLARGRKEPQGGISRRGRIWWIDFYDQNRNRIQESLTGKVGEVPLNAEARKVIQAWGQSRLNEFVFYNPGTGKPFVDLKAGFRHACRKAGIEG